MHEPPLYQKKRRTGPNRTAYPALACYKEKRQATVALDRSNRETRGDPDHLLSDSTLDVLERARDGDTSAVRVLIERTLGPLKRWARGRLPRYARASANTDDVVQDAIIRVLGRLERFEHRTVDGLQAYLRESVRNRIRDEIRKLSRRGIGEKLPDAVPAETYSPLEQVILKERAERYLEALRTLRPEDRLAVIFRLEHRYSFAEIADRLGKSSPDAARMAVNRAVKRLAEALGVSPPVKRPDASDASGSGGGDRGRTGS
jgi:RNA polymerase sigma-70 factor (ECF subfamily)